MSELTIKEQAARVLCGRHPACASHEDDAEALEQAGLLVREPDPHAPAPMSLVQAAMLLERLGVGGQGPQVGVATSRIIAEPAYAREVYERAREPRRDDVERAARVLGI